MRATSQPKRRTASFAVQAVMTAIGIPLAIQFGAAVDTFATLKFMDADLQSYNDTVIKKYNEEKLAFELEVQQLLDYMQAREEFKQNLDATRDEMEAALSAENGATITIAIPKVTPLKSDYDLQIPQEPDAPAPYVAPAAPEARADFLQWGHEWGKSLYQWYKDLS